MIRNFSRMDMFLDKLLRDVYPQPQDDGHTALAKEFIDKIMSMVSDVNSVLDLGCGEGFCQEFFNSHGVSEYLGICWGTDFGIAQSKHRSVARLDFSFLPIGDGTWDMLFARHSLEHSPMPLLTLMEWHRVSRKYLSVVLPIPDYWGYSGKNHYYVLNDLQWENLFDVSGFSVVWKNIKSFQMNHEEGKPEDKIEYQYLLEKKDEN